MATFAFEVKKESNRFGRHQIFLRITENRKLKRVKMAISVAKVDDFNPTAKNNKWIRPNEPNHKIWNEDLAQELEKAQRIYRELSNKGIATFDNLADALSGKENKVSFLTYAKEQTEKKYLAGSIETKKKYNNFCNKLESYLKTKGKTDILFTELTHKFVSDFERHLSTLENENKPENVLHKNTIAKTLFVFRAIINNAIRESYIEPQNNPFTNYKVQTIPTMKEKLTKTELEKIKALDLPKGSRIWDVRNFFMFSFYCAGMRAGDFIQLKWSNITPEGRLVYVMDKNHKKRDLPLVQQALDILDLYTNDDVRNPNDYIFPLLDNEAEYAKFDIDTMHYKMKEKLKSAVSSKNALINNNLKKIKELAGINKKLTFHIARHSFASLAKEMDVPSGDIKAILAHSKLETTERYMGEFDTSRTDKTLENVFIGENNTTSTLLSLCKSLTDEQKINIINYIQSMES